MFKVSCVCLHISVCVCVCVCVKALNSHDSSSTQYATCVSGREGSEDACASPCAPADDRCVCARMLQSTDWSFWPSLLPFHCCSLIPLGDADEGRGKGLSRTHTQTRTLGSLSAWALLLHPPCPSPGGPGPAFVCASGWQPPCIFNANLLSVLTNRLARRG